jgi:hypothetical protein
MECLSQPSRICSEEIVDFTTQLALKGTQSLFGSEHLMPHVGTARLGVGNDVG